MYSRAARDHAAPPMSPCPGTTISGSSASSSLEHGDPPLAVDVGVVGREIREDREAALLDEIAGEEDALAPAGRRPGRRACARPPGAQLHPASAEVELARRRRRPRRARPARRPRARFATPRRTSGTSRGRRCPSRELVELRAVVDDRRARPNACAPKPCSGWKWVIVSISWPPAASSSAWPRTRAPFAAPCRCRRRAPSPRRGRSRRSGRAAHGRPGRHRRRRRSPAACR